MVMRVDVLLARLADEPLGVSRNVGLLELLVVGGLALTLLTTELTMLRSIFSARSSSCGSASFRVSKSA